MNEFPVNTNCSLLFWPCTKKEIDSNTSSQSEEYPDRIYFSCNEHLLCIKKKLSFLMTFFQITFSTKQKFVWKYTPHFHFYCLLPSVQINFIKCWAMQSINHIFFTQNVKLLQTITDAGSSYKLSFIFLYVCALFKALSWRWYHVKSLSSWVWLTRGARNLELDHYSNWHRSAKVLWIHKEKFLKALHLSTLQYT